MLGFFISAILTVLLFPIKLTLESLQNKSKDPNSSFLDRMETNLTNKVKSKVPKDGKDVAKTTAKATVKAAKTTAKVAVKVANTARRAAVLAIKLAIKAIKLLIKLIKLIINMIIK